MVKQLGLGLKNGGMNLERVLKKAQKKAARKGSFAMVLYEN